MLNYYYQQTDNQKFQDLRLIFCGREACPALHSWGPAVRPNYIIHYILKGRGIYRIGNETFQLHEKEGFLIEPEVQTFYQADRDDPWYYFWVGFDGKLAPVLLKELGLGNGRLTFYCGKPEELEQIFSSILKNQQYSGVNDLILESQLYRFFAVLMQNCALSLPVKGQKGNIHVQGAIQYIRNNYYNRINVEDIAAYVGVNRSYLFTLFKKEIGMSPSEYLINFRLTRAAEMLRLTDYSVESIAYSCGYQDPLVFSKAFKRKYHMTPLRARKEELHYEHFL